MLRVALGQSPTAERDDFTIYPDYNTACTALFFPSQRPGLFKDFYCFLMTTTSKDPLSSLTSCSKYKTSGLSPYSLFTLSQHSAWMTALITKNTPRHSHSSAWRAQRRSRVSQHRLPASRYEPAPTGVRVLLLLRYSSLRPKHGRGFAGAFHALHAPSSVRKKERDKTTSCYCQRDENGA